MGGGLFGVDLGRVRAAECWQRAAIGVTVDTSSVNVEDYDEEYDEGE